MSAKYSSSELLRLCKVKLNRPSADEAFTVTTADDVWYDLLSEAQDQVMGQLAAICPEPMYGDLTQLQTSDSGASFIFDTDVDGDDVHAFGHYELYANTQGYPDSPLVEGVDFIWLGSKIVVPNGRTMSTPYGRWVTPPHKIDATNQPVLQPKYARVLIVDRACALAAEQRLKQDPSAFEKSYAANLARVLLDLKTSAYGQGGRASQMVQRPWWNSGDLD